MQSSYYDPTVGRFINADADVSTGRGFTGNNMFAYCFSNPIAYIDPTGAFPVLNYLRDFFEEAVDVLKGGLVGTAIKYYNYYNNEKQQSAIPNGYIDDQNKVDYMRLGGFGAGWNGCGWIAVYNAMIMIGNPQQAADVIRFFDRAGNTILYGTFGASPTAISEYLGSQKLTGKMNAVPFVMPNNIETVAKQATACILLYIHDSGAHYVALRWNGTEYEVYNSPGFKYASIEEYINRVGTFVTIWCID